MIKVVCIKKVKIKWEWATMFHILANTPVPQKGKKYVVIEYLSFGRSTFYKLKGFKNYFESTHFEFVTRSTAINDPTVRELVVELVVSKGRLN